MRIALLCALIALCAAGFTAAFRPVVLMHGIGADASSMNPVVQWINETMPGTYVKNVEIGNGYWDTFLMKMDDQVEDFCKQLAGDPNLAGTSINLIGYSQGGLIARGYIERCNNPPVHNFITWSSPHEGVFGLPEVNLKWIIDLMAKAPYSDEAQDHISFAGYWKDPYDLDEYLRKSSYLADVNNERSVNSAYRDRMLSLNSFTLLYSTVDNIVVPRESGWFEFFKPRSQSESDVIPLRNSTAYTDDLLGLRTLDARGRLNLYACSCRHQDYPTDTCRDVFNQYTLPMLKD